MTIPRIERVVETVLYVDDLGRAMGFYEDLLGLRRMRGDGERFQAFDAGGGSVLLLFKRGGTLAPTPVPGGVIPPHDGSGPLHIGLAVTAENYEAWRARLQGRGVAIEGETRWERGGRSLYFRDPDGHLVELITPGIWENYQARGVHSLPGSGFDAPGWRAGFGILSGGIWPHAKGAKGARVTEVS